MATWYSDFRKEVKYKTEQGRAKKSFWQCFVEGMASIFGGFASFVPDPRDYQPSTDFVCIDCSKIYNKPLGTACPSCGVALINKDDWDALQDDWETIAKDDWETIAKDMNKNVEK